MTIIRHMDMCELYCFKKNEILVCDLKNKNNTFANHFFE